MGPHFEYTSFGWLDTNAAPAPRGRTPDYLEGVSVFFEEFALADPSDRDHDRVDWRLEGF